MRARRLALALTALGLLLPGPQGLMAQEIVDPTLKADPRGFHVGLDAHQGHTRGSG